MTNSIDSSLYLSNSFPPPSPFPQHDGPLSPDLESSLSYPLSPITQLDGAFSPILPVSSVPTVQTNTLTVAGAGTSTHTVMRSKFTLNKDRQLTGLYRDANIPDLDITVSPVAHNVTLKCSTGFYTEVVLPTFTEICSPGSVCPVSGVLITCSGITGRTDDGNSNVTAVLTFSLNYEDGSSAGGVTIHLHHTTRRVQLQGSTLVHGKTRAPVWFVDAFLKPKLSAVATDRKIAIDNLNETVKNVLGKHLGKPKDLGSQKYCNQCKSALTGRSSPVLCQHCNAFYHTKCFKSREHLCNIPAPNPVLAPVHNIDGSTPPRPLSALPITPGHLLTLVPHTVAPSVSTDHLVQASPGITTTAGANSHSNPGQQDSVPLSMTPGLPVDSLAGGQADAVTPHYSRSGPVLTNTQQDTSVLALTQLSTVQNADLSQPSSILVPSEPAYHSNLNPDAIPFPHTSQPGRLGTQKQKPRTKKANIATDPLEVSMEFKNMEISTLQARLQKLETEVKDLRFRNSILMDRNKTLEESKKNDIYNQHFPTTSDQAAPQSSSHHHTCCSQPLTSHPCVHSAPTCSTVQHRCRGHSHDSHGDNTSNTLVTISTSVSDLGREVHGVKLLLNSLLAYHGSTQPSNPPAEPDKQTPSTTSPERLNSSDSPVSLDGFTFGEDNTMTDLN